MLPLWHQETIPSDSRSTKATPAYLATMKRGGGRIRASWMKMWLRDAQKPHQGA